MTTSTSSRYGFTDQPAIDLGGHHPRLYSIALLALLLVALLTLGGCYAPSQATLELVEDGISANRGHADDDSLTAEAKLIGLTNHDNWQQLRYTLTGQEVDADVAERRDARSAQ